MCEFVVESTKDEILKLARHKEYDALTKRLCKTMEFGTAGQYESSSSSNCCPSMRQWLSVSLPLCLLHARSWLRMLMRLYCMFSHSIDIGATISGILPLFLGDVRLF